MSGSLEDLWNRENICFWSAYSNFWFCDAGIFAGVDYMCPFLSTTLVSQPFCSWNAWQFYQYSLTKMAPSVCQKHDSNEDLAYWLSTSSTLLIMLQKSLKAAGSSGGTPRKKPQTQSSFLGRMVCFATSLLQSPYEPSNP